MTAKQLLDEIFDQEPTPTRSGQPLKKLHKTITFRGVTYYVIFIEQNPKKTTKYAKRAKLGERIAWGFVNGAYTFRVSDTEGFVKL